jgi:hypothetical protein
VKYGCLLASQHIVGRATASAPLRWAIAALRSRRLSHWAFNQYLAITPSDLLQARLGYRHVPAELRSGAAVDLI